MRAGRGISRGSTASGPDTVPAKSGSDRWTNLVSRALWESPSPKTPCCARGHTSNIRSPHTAGRQTQVASCFINAGNSHPGHPPAATPAPPLLLPTQASGAGVRSTPHPTCGSTLTLLRFRCFSCYSTPIPRRQIVFPEYSDAALGPAAPPACSGVECSSGLHKWLWLPTGLDGEVAPDTLAPAPAISPFSKQSALRCQPLLPLMFRRAALGRP